MRLILTTVEVSEGDPVIGGTIARSGRLVVRATKVGKDTQLAALVRLVEQAQSDKARIQRLADRICGVFVPVVLGLAVLTFLGWLAIGGSVEHAFSSSLAVLIMRLRRFGRTTGTGYPADPTTRAGPRS